MRTSPSGEVPKAEGAALAEITLCWIDGLRFRVSWLLDTGYWLLSLAVPQPLQNPKSPQNLFATFDEPENREHLENLV